MGNNGRWRFTGTIERLRWRKKRYEMEDDGEGMGDGGKRKTIRYGQWSKGEDDEKRGWRKMRKMGKMVESGG